MKATKTTRPPLMSHADRRRLIEAPLPIIRVPGRSHAGTAVIVDSLTSRFYGRPRRALDPREVTE